MQRKFSIIKREMHKKLSVMVVRINLIVRNFLFHLTVCTCVCVCVCVCACVRACTRMQMPLFALMFLHMYVRRPKIKLGYQFSRAIFLAS